MAPQQRPERDRSDRHPALLARRSRDPGRPWTDFGAFSWRDARYFEYGNVGPGVAASPDRSQLTREQARTREPRDYLAGTDNWRP